MQYRILVFNQKLFSEFKAEELLHALLDVSFTTLCVQYQLDTAQVEPAKSKLEVVVSKARILPYFTVKYGSSHDQPIIVYEWDKESERGQNILEGVLNRDADQEVAKHLLGAKTIIEIELAPVQLKDMGLLLAYEIARWTAVRGEGVILGLENTWYYLNRHQAFIPIN